MDEPDSEVIDEVELDSDVEEPPLDTRVKLPV